MSFALAKILGGGGSGLILLGVVMAALLYRGRDGERYSPLNHYISELGEVGVSRAAWLFNAGLMLGGLLLVAFNIGLGMRLGSLLGWLGAAAGTIAVLGVAFVGVFPMNNIQPHTTAAMTYFRAGLFMTFFYGLAIFFQPREGRVIPLAVNILTFLALASYAAFLIIIRVDAKKRAATTGSALDPSQQEFKRPRFWIVPAVEWSIFFTTMLWLLGTSLAA